MMVVTDGLAILTELSDQWFGPDDRSHWSHCEVQDDGSVRCGDIELAPAGTLSPQQVAKIKPTIDAAIQRRAEFNNWSKAE